MTNASFLPLPILPNPYRRRPMPAVRGAFCLGWPRPPLTIAIAAVVLGAFPVYQLFDLIRLILTRPTLSSRAIAAALGASKSTVCRFRKLLAQQGCTWEELRELPLSALKARFVKTVRKSAKTLPDFEALVAEMKNPIVTGMLLWEEYLEQKPAKPLSYPQFAHRLKQFSKTRGVEFRQTHRPGDCVQIDFSGVLPSYQNPQTGELVRPQLFVGVLPASDYTFACCTPTQSVPDFLDANARMFEFFGGVPAAVVPDNLASGVSKPGRDLVVQRNFLDFARHYGFAVLPAQPGKPRHKGKVEGAVKIAQHRILAALRKRTFFSFEELDAAILEKVQLLNKRPFQKKASYRREVFERSELPALHALPADRYEYAIIRPSCTVPLNYHVPVLGHFYSVPHGLVGKRVESRVLNGHVEFWFDGARVARHVRSTLKGGYTTLPEHQTDAHRAQASKSPAAFLEWATAVGPHTHELVARQFSQKVPLQGMPAVEGIRGLGRRHGDAVLEQAAAKALALKMPTLANVRRLIQAGGAPAHGRQRVPTPAAHQNIRGPDYYRKASVPC